MIVLAGFMGAGKSTVGRLLAERLGRPFVDSDDAVERRAGASIPEIFAERGETAFRALEQQTIADLLTGDDVVLALGGGSLGSSTVRDALVGHTVVHLDVSVDEAVRRVGDDPGRPMLRSHDVASLHTARHELYARTATFAVPVDGRAPADVVADILTALAGDTGPDRTGDIVPPTSTPTSETHARVVLVGPPGAGTTTVGRLVASRLGLPVVDVDEEIERRAGRPVGDVFVDEGEGRYRELEREAALGLLAREDGIVVLGGGAVLDPTVARTLEEAPVAFLDVAIADAAKRIGFDANPGLVLLNPRRSWIVQMQRRRPAYEAVATWTIDTAGRSAQDVADELVGLLEGAEA